MATHRGVRSELGEQRRYAKRTIQISARLDRRKAEQICMLTRTQVLDAIQGKFSNVLIGAVDIEKGEVIADTRGQGSFQRLPSNFVDWALAIGI